jgi:dienelactone hydrolase
MKSIFYLFTSIIFLSACTGNNSNDEIKSNNSEEPKSTITDQEIDENTVVTEELTYKSDGLEMKGFLAKPTSGDKLAPGVLVVHEWWGHNEHARNKAKALADLGYYALAIDMYGDGKQAKHPDDAGKFAGMVLQNIEEAKKRFDAAYNTLTLVQGVDKEKIAAIGFCFGGSVVMTMANMGANLKAVTAFHSGVALPVMPKKGKLNTPILVLNGADDPFVKQEQKEVFKRAMEASEVDFRFVDYPGVVHAYTNPGADTIGEKFNLPLAYNQKADEKSWNEMKSFFEKHLN